MVATLFAVEHADLDTGHDHREEHLPEDVQWFGNAVVVEHRYIWTILDGIQDAGLAVSRG